MPSYFTPNLFFIFLFILFIYITHGRCALIWDEFSHWALATKNMFYLNNLGLGADSTIVAKTYLSGSAIFQYFILKIYGSFSEGVMYFAHDILLISLVLPMFKKFRFTDFKRLPIYLTLLIVLFLPTLCYWNLYTSLYVDCLLGFAFFASIYNYYTVSDNKRGFRDILLCANFMFLIFVKDFGLPLALLSFAIILINELFIKNRFKFKNLFKNIWRPILYFGTAIVIKLIWGIYTSHMIPSTGDGVSLTSKFIDMLTGFGSLSSDSWQYTTALNFTREMFHGNLIYFVFNLSYVGIILLFMIMSFLLYKDDEKDKSMQKSYKWLSFSIVGGAICYAFALLMCYLCIFGEYEALRLASFSRYMNSYALAMLMLGVFLLINKYIKEKNKFYILTLIATFIIFVSAEPQSYINTILLGRYNANYTVDQREPYNEMTEKINNYAKKDEYVYLIATNNDGFSYWTLRYTISPIKTNKDQLGWSLGLPYDENDIWTRDVAPEEWLNNLVENYEYVALYHVDDEFISIYGDLFNSNIKSNQLYKVNKQKRVLELVA